MKLFGRYLKDQLLFLFTYNIAILLIVAYYVLSGVTTPVRYPIYITAFIELLYMIVRYIMYALHDYRLNQLKVSAVKADSECAEYRQVYTALLEVHARYQSQLTSLRQKNKEDKRRIAFFVHNLKTPVTVSNILLQRAEQGEITDAQAVEGIKEQTERLIAGLDMLLNLQRLEEFQNDYVPQPLDLAKEVRTVINDNKSLFISNAVYPRFDEMSESAPVLTDSKWNKVMISQIISNAVKYSAGMGQKDASLHVSFHIEVRGEYTELTIRDEGIGIPQEDLARVFDAFYTGNNGRAGYGSSGIGLYLCRQICDGLGQKIRIENANPGCKVTITYLSKL